MTLQTRRLRSIEQVRAFVEGNEAVDYGHRDRESAYGFVGELLGRLRYRTLGKRDKGMVRRFLAKATGISAVGNDVLSPDTVAISMILTCLVKTIWLL